MTLNEDFNWNDGEKQKRKWKIRKVGENKYEGTAPDVIGIAKGVSYGSAFKFEYNLSIPYKDKKIKVDLMIGYLNKTIKLQLIELLFLNLVSK